MRKAHSVIKDLDSAVDVLMSSRVGRMDAADTSDLLDLLSKVHSIDRKAIEMELVDELRKRGEPWALVGEFAGGVDAAAAHARYTEKVTPTTRHRLTPDSLPGYSIKQAAAELGISTPTIYNRMKWEGSTTWWSEFQTEGERGKVKRIIDLKGLEAAKKPAAKTVSTKD